MQHSLLLEQRKQSLTKVKVVGLGRNLCDVYEISKVSADPDRI
jgi:hypothetical protein